MCLLIALCWVSLDHSFYTFICWSIDTGFYYFVQNAFNLFIKKASGLLNYDFIQIQFEYILCPHQPEAQDE